MKISFLYLLPLILLSFVMCDNNKDKQNAINQKALQGDWVFTRSEVSVESNDSLSSEKIASSMEAELSVLRTSLSFNDNEFFSVKSTFDSIVMAKDGRYLIDDNKIVFSFPDQDSAIVKFDYEFEVNNDTLCIMLNTLKEIQSILDNKTYSDSNIKLQYGIKDRNNIELQAAHIKRIYIRAKSDSVNLPTINDSVAIKDSVPSL